MNSDKRIDTQGSKQSIFGDSKNSKNINASFQGSLNVQEQILSQESQKRKKFVSFLQTPFNVNNIELNIEQSEPEVIDMEDGTEKAIKIIQLSDQKSFQLQAINLQDLRFLTGYPLKSLRVINLSKNLVSSIDVLSQYQQLKEIDASFNYIEDVNLNLPKLEVLNLQNNYLKKFPIIEYSMSLKIINLNSNHLENLNDMMPHFTPNIQELDIGNNSIDFDFNKLNDYNNFHEKILEMKILKSLFIRGNDFLIKEYLDQYEGFNIQDQIFKHNKQLEYINEEDREVLKKKIQEAKNEKENQKIIKIKTKMKDKDDYNQIVENQTIDLKKKEKKQKEINKKNEHSLQDLLNELESANAYSSQALKHLKNLAEKVDENLLLKDKIQEFLAPNKNQNEIEELIDTFIMNAQMLIINSSELQGIMLSILAKLSIIEYMDFGVQCFNLLKDVMKSGKELQHQVAKVIETEVIYKLKEPDPTKISKALLKGLIDLIQDDEENSKMLAPMFEMQFPVWLRNYCELLDVKKAKNQIMDDNENYDAVIQLFSVSVFDKQNVERSKEQEIVPKITKIFRQTRQENKRYIPCLNSIQRLSNNSATAADDFIISFVHIDLIDEINKSMQIYKRSNSLFDKNSKESVIEQMHKYQVLAAEIIALGSLMNSQHRLHILDTPTILDIIQIMSHQRTDPILLTAICKFSLNLFKCQELKSDADYMGPILDKISNMSYLIPYLGGSMYSELLLMTNRYHYSKQKNYIITSSNKNQKDQKKKQDVSQLNISKISKQTKKNKDGKKGEDAILISEEEKINISLKNLDDWIVNDLFVAIINLIQFFQEEAQVNEVNPLFKDIQESLDLQKREDALFNALLIQNNEVQVSVVNCLFAVPVSGFDDNEVSKLSQIVCTCKNLSSGQTELIISTVFWILFKFIFFTNDEEVAEICKNFQKKYGEFIVTEALSILQRNLERQIYDEDEDREKYTLSLSVINFLKISSSKLSPIMHNYLRIQKNHKVFKQILLNEDLYSTLNVQRMPIDIENTIIGRDIQSLIQMIQGEFSQSLQPYSDVSLRMIMGMANILMNINNQNYKHLKETENAVKDLLGFSEFSYKQNKQNEMTYWIDQYNFVDSLSDEQNYDIIQQHTIFTKQEQVVNLLIDFLVTKLPLNEQLLNAMSDPLFSYEYQQLQNKNKVSLLHQVREKTKQLQNKFKKRYFNRQDPFSIRKYRYLKKNKSQNDLNQDDDIINNDDNDNQDEEQIKSQYLKDTDEMKSNCNMNLEELGQDYFLNQAKNQGDDKQDQEGDNEKIGDDKLNLGKQINIQQSDQKQFKSSRGDGFENKKLRSLSISACLRCIYASIEYAPTMDLRMQAIKNLNNPQLLCQLTQLCDSVEWDENSNIGSKYLRVMRHIILMPFDKSKEETHKVMYYNLISIVIQKLLKKIVTKLKSEIQLTDGDKITNYEISYIFLLIMQQTNYFVFSNLDIIEVYRQKELQISNIKKELSLKIGLDPQNISMDDQLQSGGTFKDTFDSKTNQYIKKCLYQDSKNDNFNQVFTKNEFSPQENFQIFLPDLRKKRTVQTKVVEFLVLKLFSKESIFSLLEILFKDMTSDHRIFDKALKLCKQEEDNDEKFQEFDNNERINKQIQEFDYNLNNELDDDENELLVAELQLQKKQENYISIKSVITIERIKDIVGEIMNTCQKKMKYDILEYIMKGVIFSEKILRESFMQEILLSADRSTYRTSLQNYINQNELTILNLNQQAASERDDAISYLGSIDSRKYMERIILCDLVDINTVIRIINQNKSTPDQSQLPDNSFIKRLFVISNKGIQIMKDVEKSVSCQNCPPYEFCPRGPQQDFFINYEDIQTIVTVPQMPQKFVIYYYASNEKQNWSSSCSQLSYKSQLKNTNLKQIQFQVQLTLNFQTYTVASQIFYCIKQIMMELDSQKQFTKKQIMQEANKNFGNQKQIGEEESKNDKSSKRFKTLPDSQIYYDLKYLISQISKEEDKQNIKNIQLIYASLIKTKCDPVSEQYFKEKIETKSVKPNLINQTALIRYITEKWIKKSSVNEEESTLLQNPVIVCVTDNYLLLLKETWGGWKFQQDKQFCNKYTRDIDFMLNSEEFPNENTKDLLKYMEDYCKKRKTDIFQLVLCVKLESIKSLIVHKNKEPSVELKCLKDRKIRIQFSSDMERQMFVDMLWEWYQENGANKQEEDDPKANNQNTPFEEDTAQRYQQDESESDDSPPDLIVYY